jgi:inorganic triphosphatase YgiF
VLTEQSRHQLESVLQGYRTVIYEEIGSFYEGSATSQAMDLARSHVNEFRQLVRLSIQDTEGRENQARNELADWLAYNRRMADSRAEATARGTALQEEFALFEGTPTGEWLRGEFQKNEQHRQALADLFISNAEIEAASKRIEALREERISWQASLETIEQIFPRDTPSVGRHHPEGKSVE